MLGRAASSRSGRARRARASSFRRRSGRGRTATTARRACGAASRATTSARSKPWSSSARPRAARSSDVMSRFRGGAIGAAAHVTSCALRQRAGKSARIPPQCTHRCRVLYTSPVRNDHFPESVRIRVAAAAWGVLRACCCHRIGSTVRAGPRRERARARPSLVPRRAAARRAADGMTPRNEHEQRPARPPCATPRGAALEIPRRRGALTSSRGGHKVERRQPTTKPKP